ncbi:enoyl-CoA hydratase/isomerase family protein [Nonomuraea longispora]|uniref:enoyl-CoA hydratase n=1 Tax=Nonomuraea longispora TaxID=1848320 RepID=A0A4R4NDJ0_9ACTN|nr:enoyl-CoA hydratase/isomerase family protein [Nonomuraea longispora]TDC07218.1 enoyl-CoA hydratase/isomerase family protein [Nonomuraea longispora]
MTAPDTAAVRIRRDGAVLVVSIDRPRKRNAINLPVVRGVRAALRSASREAEVRTVVLTGSPVFSAGADIGTYAEGDLAAIATLMDEANAMCDEIADSPVPVIAAVEGVALGGGFECVLACDLVVAAEDARFGLPEVGLGLLPGWGGTQRLTAQVGPRRAKGIVLLGEQLDAATAADLGLVTTVCASGRALAVATAIAERLATRPMRAVAEACRVIDLAPHGRREERAALDRLFATTEAADAIRAFVEKRSSR